MVMSYIVIKSLMNKTGQAPFFSGITMTAPNKIGDRIWHHIFNKLNRTNKNLILCLYFLENIFEMSSSKFI